jgi:hypothetical protein
MWLGGDGVKDRAMSRDGTFTDAAEARQQSPHSTERAKNIHGNGQIRTDVFLSPDSGHSPNSAQPKLRPPTTVLAAASSLTENRWLPRGERYLDSSSSCGEYADHCTTSPLMLVFGGLLDGEGYM